jgi:hypothetical protein
MRDFVPKAVLPEDFGLKSKDAEAKSADFEAKSKDDGISFCKDLIKRLVKKRDTGG